MPIVAMCPYCREGGVRAPNRAAGWTATCPTCKSSFTIVPPDPLAPPQLDSPSPRPRPATPAPAPVEETRPHALADDVTEPSPVLPAAPIARKSNSATATAWPPSLYEPSGQSGFGIALVAVTLFGVGLVASQFPYGRIIGLAVCAVGLLLGLLCLLAEGRTRIVAGVATGLNLLAVVLLLFAPSWLGLTPWQSETDSSDPKTVLAIGHGGQSRTPADWVDASSASWAYGDIHVTIRSAAIGPIELSGPNGVKRTTKESFLQLLVLVANVGVERRIELSGWAVGPSGSVRLTDPSGNALPVKTFGPGWELPDRPKPGGLFPGKSAEVLFIFELPPSPPGPKVPAGKTETGPKIETLRLELPGAAIGVPDHSVRFHIPGSFFFHRPGPRGVTS